MAVVSVLKLVPQEHNRYKTGSMFRKNSLYCVWKVCGNLLHRSLEIVGSYYSVEELSELLLRDRRLYEISEGGVTFSGWRTNDAGRDSI